MVGDTLPYQYHCQSSPPQSQMSLIIRHQLPILHRLRHLLGAPALTASPQVDKYVAPHYVITFSRLTIFVVPTPFASHAFHPVDGYLQSVPYHLFIFIFPLHRLTFLGLFVFVNFWSILVRLLPYSDGSRAEINDARSMIPI
jgi:hypothetical protein